MDIDCYLLVGKQGVIPIIEEEKLRTKNLKFGLEFQSLFISLKKGQNTGSQNKKIKNHPSQIILETSFCHLCHQQLTFPSEQNKYSSAFSGKRYLTKPSSEMSMS